MLDLMLFQLCTDVMPELGSTVARQRNLYLASTVIMCWKIITQAQTLKLPALKCLSCFAQCYLNTVLRLQQVICGNPLLCYQMLKGACWLGRSPVEYPLMFSFCKVDPFVHYVMRRHCSCMISLR